jgi:hypothetical protein
METNATESMNGRRSKDEIQGHIEETQEELRHTLEAIGESISPGEVLDTALHALRVGPGEFAANLGRSVRENPLAIGLLGTGLAWLMLGTSTRESIRGRAGELREKGHGLRERAEAKGHQLRERAEAKGQSLRGKAEKMRGKAEHKAEEMRGKAEGAAQESAGETRGRARAVADASREKAGEARKAASRGYQRARSMASEQPLFLAAVGLFAGAAAAAMLPRSQAEERLFGEPAEHVTEMAEDAARGLGEGVREGLESDGGEPAPEPLSGRDTSDPTIGQR